MPTPVSPKSKTGLSTEDAIVAFSITFLNPNSAPIILSPDRGASGEWRIVNAQAATLRDEKGSPIMMSGFAIDITERKRSEKILQRNESQLNSTQKIIKVGGWEWNVSNGTMFWTDEVYHIHGFLPEEIKHGSKEHIERSIECYKSEDRSVIQDAFKQCVQRGVPYDLEFSFTKVSGENIWIRTIAKPVLENGKVVKVIGNIMDITQSKKKMKSFTKLIKWNPSEL